MFTVAFEVPYTPSLSKNQKYLHNRCNIINPNYIKAKNDITFLFKTALKKYPQPIKAKTRVDYIWYRNSMRGDTSNLREGIDDAIKVALPYDDSYFIGSHNYEIIKNSQSIIKIIVTIYKHM